MNPFQALDENKACLRILELLYVRRDRDHPKMMLQGIAEMGGVSKSKFNKAIQTLLQLGLLEEQIENTPGKKGVSKILKLTEKGARAADQVQRLHQLIQPSELKLRIIP